MVSILLSYATSNPKDRKLIYHIEDELTKRNYQIYNLKNVEGEGIAEARADIIDHCDAFVVLISEDSFENKEFYNELIQLQSYSKFSSKLFYPATLPSANAELLSENILEREPYAIDLYEDFKVLRFIRDLEYEVNNIIGKKLAQKGKAEAIQKKIEKSAAEFLNPISSDLQTRESYLQKEATKWYSRGFIALLSGVVAAVIALGIGLFIQRDLTNYGLVALFTIKSILILGLLIAASKYCFNLAKSFMNESLKVADRRHAISFGEFYMKVYDQNVEQSDLKEIFRDWNISNGNSSFMQQSSEDHDPKVLEQVTKLVQSIKGK